jgi:hypothetical protein
LQREGGTITDATAAGVVIEDAKVIQHIATRD